jgi:hypothetical protein
MSSGGSSPASLVGVPSCCRSIYSSAVWTPSTISLGPTGRTRPFMPRIQPTSQLPAANGVRKMT